MLNNMNVESGVIRVALTNLGLYNEGVLAFQWLNLPATDAEIEMAMEAVGIGGRYEEWFFTDWESDFPGVAETIGEYSNLEELNELAETLEALDDDQQEAVNAYIDLIGDDIEQAIETARNYDYIIYGGCSTMAQVAEQYAEETGILYNVPDSIAYYIDYAAMGRDMNLEGYFTETSSGDMIQLLI